MQLSSVIIQHSHDIDSCIRISDEFINQHHSINADDFLTTLRNIPNENNKFSVLMHLIKRQIVPKDLSIDQTLSIFQSASEPLKFEILSNLLAFSSCVNPFFILVRFEENDEE